MEKISTLKLGAAMLVLGPFLLLLDMVYILLPFDIINLLDVNTILINLPGSDAILYLASIAVDAGMYISAAGFLLLIRHYFKVEVEAGDEKIYRFVDYGLALYIALELLVITLMFLLIPFADNSPGPYIGFIYWLYGCFMALSIGFMLLWAYGLFRRHSKMAMLFSLCYIIFTCIPFIPYNNTEFPEQQDAYYEQKRAAIPKDYEIKYVEESDLDLDEKTTDVENSVTSKTVVTVVVPDNPRVFGPGSSVYLLILAYTWLRFGRHLFSKPQPEQEQPESA